MDIRFLKSSILLLVFHINHKLEIMEDNSYQSSYENYDKPNNERITQLINSFFDTYDNNITTQLGQINNQSLMLYLVIFVILLFVAKLFQISLSIIFFLAVAFLICYIIYSKRKLDKVVKQQQLKIKQELIIPRPKNFGSYPDVIDFFYSIKEFYNVNPNAYHEAIKDMDKFFYLYEEIMQNKMLYYKQNVDVAVGFARDALNQLQSIIYNLDVDKTLTNKYHESLKEFHLIIYQYINRIIKKANERFNPAEINTTSEYYQQYGPRPFNYFNDRDNKPQFEFY